MSIFIYRLILLARTYFSLFAERASIGATCLKKIDNQKKKKRKKRSIKILTIMSFVAENIRNCTYRYIYIYIDMHSHSHTHVYRVDRKQK